MPERAPSRNPEHISPPMPMDGLHGRLVMADQKFLRPGETAQTADLAKVTSFEQRNYNPFEKASEKNRDAYWEQKGITSFDAQKEAWRNSLVGSFSTDSSKATLEKLSPFLHKAGILTEQQGATLTADHAKKIYERYFDGDHSGGIKKFVTDILETYQTNGNVNMDAINQNMQQITWFANIFGEEGKDMVTQLVAAEAKLKTTPDLVTKLSSETNNKMRINDLNDTEKRILTFITDAQDADTPTQVGQRRQEDDEEEEQTPEHFTELTMWKYKNQIQEMIRNNPRSILIGGTGTGKTKETPKFIREMLKPGEMLVVTEPTQINVSNLAKKVAEEEEIILGKEIGFQHGDDRIIHDENDTRFMTEGTLLRQLKTNKRIPKVRYLMIDEVHIQSKNTEQLIERALEAQRLRQQDIDNGAPGATPLTILFTSATVDKEKLQRKCKVETEAILDVPAAERKHAITPHYETREIDSKDKPARAAQIIKEIIESGKKGDICEAVASVNDIETYAKAIEALGLDVEIHKVHTNSPDEAKAQVSRKRTNQEKRRIMIGTNFIQTGVTMPNLKHMINSGEQIVMQINTKTGLTYAKRQKQTQAEIAQWDGRVGRVSSGDVYNLFTENDFKSRPKYPEPEMKRSDLTDLVLQIKAQKEKNIFDYDFLSSPLDPDRIAFANESLKILGAVNADGSLNAIGERMADLTTNFHYARMIAQAEQEGKGVEQTCTITAMTEGSSSIFADKQKVMNRFRNPKSDFLTHLAIWRAYEQNTNEETKKKWCEDTGIVYPAMVKISKNRERLLKGAKNKNGQDASDDELGSYIATGFKDKQMQYDPTRSDARRSAYRWLRGHANDVTVYIDRDSAIPSTSMNEYIVSASNGEVREDARTRQKYVFISNCQVVKPEWLV